MKNSRNTKAKLHDNILLPLLEKGLNYTEISKILNITISAISTYCKRRGWKSNFKYNVSFDEKEYLILYNQGLNDCEIGRRLGTNSKKLSDFRKRKGLLINRVNNYILSDNDKAFFIGFLLGDGYFSKEVESYSGMYAHSLKQEEYFYWKYNQQVDKFGKITYSTYLSKQTGKYYSKISTQIKCNICLKEIYDVFYADRVKSIYDKEWFEKYFTDLSLAIWFGDDGYKTGKTCCFATNNFNRETLEYFVDFLKRKYDFLVTIRNNNTLYIKHKSKDKFKEIINGILPETMLYKIN